MTSKLSTRQERFEKNKKTFFNFNLIFLPNDPSFYFFLSVSGVEMIQFSIKGLMTIYFKGTLQAKMTMPDSQPIPLTALSELDINVDNFKY